MRKCRTRNVDCSCPGAVKVTAASEVLGVFAFLTTDGWKPSVHVIFLLGRPSHRNALSSVSTYSCTKNTDSKRKMIFLKLKYIKWHIGWIPNNFMCSCIFDSWQLSHVFVQFHLSALAHMHMLDVKITPGLTFSVCTHSSRKQEWAKNRNKLISAQRKWG